MVFLRWLIGGLLGAFIGSIVWVAIGYALNAEVGYVAWAIGLVCGLGVQMVGGEEDGIVPGLVAVVCAALAILTSKYLVISILMGGIVSEMPDLQITDETMIASLAEEMIAESEEAGKKIKLPQGYYEEDSPLESRFPSKILKKAKSEWAKVPAEEQEKQKQERKDFGELVMQQSLEALKWQAFKESFNAFDLLWFGLATFTAFRVGSGLGSDDE